MDRIYAECPLKSGYKDMLTSPYDTAGVQHSLTKNNRFPENNYGKFTQKGTNYQNIIEAKKAAEQARIAEAEVTKAADNKPSKKLSKNLPLHAQK